MQHKIHSVFIRLTFISILILLLTSNGVVRARNFSNVTADPSFQAVTESPNGVQLVFKAEARPNEQLTYEQLQTTRKIVEDRAGNIGLRDATVRIEGTDIIVVEFADTSIETIQGAIKTIQERGFLEFIDGGDTPLEWGERICTTKGGCPSNELTSNDIDDILAQGLAENVSTSIITKANVTPTPQAVPQAQPTEPLKVWQTVVGGDEVDGSKVAVVHDNSWGLPQVSFTLSIDGASKLARFTSYNINMYMPIVLDNKVLSSPIIKGIILNGEGVIEGLTISEANALAAQLKSGTLPLRLKLIQANKVSIASNQQNTGWVQVALGIGVATLMVTITAILFAFILSKRSKQLQG